MGWNQTFAARQSGHFLTWLSSLKHRAESGPFL